MHVVLDTPGGTEEDVELRLGREDATVGDLLDALGESARARGIVLDGRFCHVDLALTEIGLYEGARINPADGAPDARESSATSQLELRVIAGFDAGRRIALTASGVTVGRDPECDLALDDEGVSRRHLRVQTSPGGLRATVTDLESVNGTWIEGRRISEPQEIEPGTAVEAGDVVLTIAPHVPALPVDPIRQASLNGTIAFNRPPRARPRSDDAPISVPDEPGEPQKPRFSVASAVGPLILGAVMVVVLHSIIYALFMLLSPVLVIGSWLEQRRHAKRSSRGDQREHAEKLETFRRQLSDRQAQALERARAGFPDLAETLRRATAPDPRLWERRPDHDDFLALSAGYGELPFAPELAERYAPSPDAEVALAEHRTLALAPVPVALGDGGVVGIVGDREQALAVARALLGQATVLHGPADVSVAVFCEPEARGAWDWVKWLPHARELGGGSRRQLAVGVQAGAALAAALAERDDDRAVLAVLDSPALIEGRGAAGRALLRARENVSGIVIARSAERLPAACTVVIELADEAGEASLSRPPLGELVDPLVAAGISADTARECALALARFEDSDLQQLGGALPDYIGLCSLIGLLPPDPDQLRRRWRTTSKDTRLVATFSLTEDGPFGIDLVADGPHGLVAGTTGAGKSELLRSLVAALAADYSPTRVNFVLVDYKGGSAFAECAELPHTVGMVTDLDEQLGERALLSMEAELRYRERMLREHRVSDLIEYDRLVGDGAAPPLPRLLVIIDEFATLAAELPDFVSSLVGIAQRGRSLGVHLLLATQRPSGAVNENIRANTNLRICLRVQNGQDSSDVIDSPEAARIPRTQPGRAHVRLGPSELIPVQTALVTAATQTDESTAVAMVPFTLTDGDRPGREVTAAEPDAGAQPSDLKRLVTAAQDAFTADGGDAPRRPWLPPLPGDIALEQLLELGPARPLAGDRGLVVSFALADDPDAQAQYPTGWSLDAGNLLLYGIGGSGTSTTLTTIALSLCETTEPDRLHMYGLDFGAGELRALGDLPHVGAVIGAAEHERQRRLLHRLRGELAHRRGLDPATRAAAPRIVLLLDGYAGFLSEHDDIGGDAQREALARVWADGPELGIHCAIAADRLGAVPTALASVAQQRLAFQLADVADYAQFGLPRRSIPAFVPGRAVIGGSAQVIQVARGRVPSRDTAGAQTIDGGPPPVDVLPESLPVSALLGAGRDEREPLFVPLGIGDDSLEPAGFELFEGDHALISGPPRTGRTTALLVVAEVVSRLYPELDLVGVAVRRSALRDCAALARLVSTPAELADLATELRASEKTTVLLIDDADTVDDPARALSDLFAAPLSNLHAIVAGRNDAMRTLGHWSVGVRRSRTGLLLQPELQVDGTLLGVTLPRRPAPPVRPGCGYRVDPGGFELLQVAQPES
jgi:S-DNA-T family DNA segregation ATPase FtsK/SpoIIIE